MALTTLSGRGDGPQADDRADFEAEDLILRTTIGIRGPHGDVDPCSVGSCRRAADDTSIAKRKPGRQRAAGEHVSVWSDAPAG